MCKMTKWEGIFLNIVSFACYNCSLVTNWMKTNCYYLSILGLKCQLDQEFNLELISVLHRIRELTSAKIGSLLRISGQVVRTHPVHPELVSGTFLCLDCQTVIKDVEQQFKYTQPNICRNPVCANRRRFLLDTNKSRFVDFQKVQRWGWMGWWQMVMVLVVFERCCCCCTLKTVDFGWVNIKKRPQEKALEFLPIVSFFLWRLMIKHKKLQIESEEFYCMIFIM